MHWSPRPEARPEAVNPDDIPWSNIDIRRKLSAYVRAAEASRKFEGDDVVEVHQSVQRFSGDARFQQPLIWLNDQRDYCALGLRQKIRKPFGNWARLRGAARNPSAGSIVLTAVVTARAAIVHDLNLFFTGRRVSGEWVRRPFLSWR